MQISINPLAEFAFATEAKRKSIIRNQKEPNIHMIPWYQLAKSRIRLAIAKKGDLQPILAGIEELKNRKPIKVRQINDRNVSIEALERFLEMKLPKVLKDIDYEVIKKPKKTDIPPLLVKGVEVIVSPDVIIKTTINGQSYLGAVKIHVAKTKTFDNNQLKHIASATYMYLENAFSGEEIMIHPDLCLAYDIFGGRIVHAPHDIIKGIKELEKICQEVKEVWTKV